MNDNKMVIKIKSIDEFKRQVEEALIEIEEMRYSIEFDGDYMQQSAHLIDPIDAELKRIKAELDAGTYQFGGAPLAFIETIEPLPLAFIPFKYLLQVINHTHMHGLSEEA